MKVLSRASCTNKLSGLPVTLVLATASTRQLPLCRRKRMRGKKSFSGRSHFGWSRSSLFFSWAMGKEMSWFLKMKKGCTCSGDVTTVEWGQNKTTPSATLAHGSVPGLYFALLLLINHLQLPEPGRGGCLHPAIQHVRTWRRPGSLAALVLLGLPAACVGLAVSVWHQMYRPWPGNTDIWRIFPWGKGLLYFFCSNTLMKIKHVCTYRGSLECAQRSEGRCERGNEPNPSMENEIFRGKLLKPYSMLAARVFLDCSSLSSGRCKEQFKYFLFISL